MPFVDKNDLPSPYINQFPDRKNIRAKFHDYSGGVYFVTICTENKIHFFGEVKDDKMNLNRLGEFVNKTLETFSTHYDYAEIPLWVVMPNHVHAIIVIKGDKKCPAIRSAISVVVGGFKQAVTMFARKESIEFDWQRRFHDHIIRSTAEMNRIARYIEENPAVWGADCFNTHTPM